MGDEVKYIDTLNVAHIMKYAFDVVESIVDARNFLTLVSDAHEGTPLDFHGSPQNEIDGNDLDRSEENDPLEGVEFHFFSSLGSYWPVMLGVRVCVATAVNTQRRTNALEAPSVP